MATPSWLKKLGNILKSVAQYAFIGWWQSQPPVQPPAPPTPEHPGTPPYVPPTGYPPQQQDDAESGV